MSPWRISAVTVVTLLFPAIAWGQNAPNAVLPATGCVTASSKDVNLEAIVREVFTEKPKRLLAEHVITQEFYENIKSAKPEICEDRNWDVTVLPRKPPVVVFDSSFLMLLFMESRSLVLGQYLAKDYPNVATLGLHAALMQHVQAQNANKKLPLTSYGEIVNRFLGKTTNIEGYLNAPDFTRQESTMFLNVIYFLTFHEFCHLNLKHLERKAAIVSLPDKALPAGKTREQLFVQLESDADACAIEIINKDEGQYEYSPISFMSLFIVSSTQAILHTVTPLPTHPSPQERLTSAYEMNLRFIERAASVERYRDTIDGVYAHFSNLLPHK